MADWDEPTVSTNYIELLDELKERDVAALLLLEGISSTNLPTNAKRWNTGGWLESWNGSGWNALMIAATGLAADAVETAKIKDAAVTTAKLNDGAVTAGKIGSGAVTTAKIGDSQVTNAKIAGNAVSSAKLATAVQDDIASRALASRTITGGTGLTGGGDLTTNRTINADLASQAEAQAGSSNTKLMTPLRTAQAIAEQVPPLIPDVGTAEVLAATAGATPGAVGTYIWAINEPSGDPVLYGSIYAGSTLRPVGLTLTTSSSNPSIADGSWGGTLQGSWQSLFENTAGGSNRHKVGLYLRVA